jgi:hypothetical protein
MIDVQLKSGLADLLVDEPPVGPDAARALRSGRRAQVRRRWSGAVGVAAGVVAVSAAVPFGAALLASPPSGTVAPGGGPSQAEAASTQLHAELGSSAIDPGRVADLVRTMLLDELPGAAVTQGNLSINKSPLSISSTYRVSRGGETWSVSVFLGRAPGVPCAQSDTCSVTHPAAGVTVADQKLAAGSRDDAQSLVHSRYAEGELVTVASLAATFGSGGALTVTSHDPESDVPWVVSLERSVSAALPDVDGLGHFGATAEASATPSAATSSGPTNSAGETEAQVDKASASSR